MKFNINFPLISDKSEIADSGGIYVGNTYAYCFSPTEQARNAELFCAAVNACRAINPADPLAAANALPDVVAALEAILANDEARMPARLGRQVERSLAALKGGAQ